MEDASNYLSFLAAFNLPRRTNMLRRQPVSPRSQQRSTSWYGSAASAAVAKREVETGHIQKGTEKRN